MRHPRGEPWPARLLVPAAAALVLGGCAGSPEPDPVPGTDRPVATGAAPGADGEDVTSSPLPLPDTSLPVTAAYPREPGFTQGLELLEDGRLLHGTGRYGDSQIRIASLDGSTELSADLPADQFGEGVTVVGDTAYQLTWQSGVVHVWGLPDLEPRPDLAIEGEGWGLCHDESRDVLWLSDGSAGLTALDPAADLAPGEQVQVRDADGPVDQLNELECVDGQVWANIWYSDDVVRIDPTDGQVTARVDLAELTAAVAPATQDDVLNGLAHDPRDGTFLVTGKEWDTIFRVDLEAAAGG